MKQLSNDKDLQEIFDLLGYLLEKEERQLKENWILHEATGMSKYEKWSFISFSIFLMICLVSLISLIKNIKYLSPSIVNIWQNILLIVSIF